MTFKIIAFYFSLLVNWQDNPLVIGPYETLEECMSVREFVDRRGYETDYCSQLPYPQDGSMLLEVGFIPYDKRT